MRARNIKPGFYLNEALAECSFPARLFFPGLWMLADRAGRLEYRPKRWKAEIFPYDNVDPAELFAELERNGLVCRYSADTMDLVWIPKFSTHQNPHIKEKASEFPAHPDEKPVLEQDLPEQKPDEHSASTVQAQCEHCSSTSVARLIPDSGFLIPDSCACAQDAHARVDHLPEISGHDAPPPETGDRPGDVATSGAGSPPSADPPRAEPVTAPHNSAASTRRPGTDPDAYSFEFEELWDQYPRKEAKGAAWIAFKASKGAGLYPGNPIACPIVAQWRASPAWQEEGGKFVPKLSNWIRDRRWDDGPPEDDAVKFQRQVEDAMAAQEARRRVRH